MVRSLTFLRPTSLEEAVGRLVEYGGEAKVLGGSTALTIVLRQGLIEPRALVQLAGIPGLREQPVQLAEQVEPVVLISRGRPHSVRRRTGARRGRISAARRSSSRTRRDGDSPRPRRGLSP